MLVVLTGVVSVQGWNGLDRAAESLAPEPASAAAPDATLVCLEDDASVCVPGGCIPPICICSPFFTLRRDVLEPGESKRDALIDAAQLAHRDPPPEASAAWWVAVNAISSGSFPATDLAQARAILDADARLSDKDRASFLAGLDLWASIMGEGEQAPLPLDL